jgi:signal transduction histidine kinase
LRINRYYLSGAIALTVCMLGAFLSLAVNLESRIKYVEAIRESASRRLEIQQLMKLLLDCETAQRGFLLTGDQRYLQPYELARQDARLALDRLADRYFGDGVPDPGAAVRQDMRRLRELSSGRLNEISATLALYDSSGPDAANALLRTNIGKDSMDELRNVVSDLERVEAERSAVAFTEWRSGVFRSQLLLTAGSLLNVALIISSVLLVNRDLRRREEQAWNLERYSDDLEQQVQRRTAALSQLSSHLQNIAEREKAAIARELHDELGGLMIAAKMDVSWLEKRLASPDDDIKLRWARVRKLLDDGLNMKRRVVETLRPTLLDNMGLVPAVKWIYQETCARAGLKCSERYPADELRLRDDAAIAVFRVIQESLTNIVKHAKATEVELAMWIEGRALRIDLHDNGVGIPDTLPASGGQGLLSMRHRVTSLGGTWRIAAAEGGGTAIHIALPLTGILEPPPGPVPT